MEPSIVFDEYLPAQVSAKKMYNFSYKNKFCLNLNPTSILDRSLPDAALKTTEIDQTKEEEGNRVFTVPESSPISPGILHSQNSPIFKSIQAEEVIHLLD